MEYDTEGFMAGSCEAHFTRTMCATRLLEAGKPLCFGIIKWTGISTDKGAQQVDSYGTAQKTSICTHLNGHLDGDGPLDGMRGRPGTRGARTAGYRPAKHRIAAAFNSAITI